VITFDPRGNGRSDRPVSPDSYLSGEYAADALAVMDATGTDRAVLVSFSRGASYALHLGAASPERVLGQIFICPTTPLAPFAPARLPYAPRFEETLDGDEGWAKDNARYWARDYPGFLEFFSSQVFTEAHSTKPAEDCVSWGLETTPETLADTRRGALRDATVGIAGQIAVVQCPCLVIQGTGDAIVGPDAGRMLAEALGSRARLVELAGSGHAPHARDPVKINLLIREFAAALADGGSCGVGQEQQAHDQDHAEQDKALAVDRVDDRRRHALLGPRLAQGQRRAAVAAGGQLNGQLPR